MRNEIEGRGKTFGNVGKRGKQIMIRKKEKKGGLQENIEDTPSLQLTK